MPVSRSRLPGFYKHGVRERRDIVAELAGLGEDEKGALSTGALSEDVADRMIENVVGTYALPVGIATNFVIDGAAYLVPFVVEEASVVAAASNAAKRCLVRGGFRTSSDDGGVMIAQVELRDARPGAAAAIRGAAEELGEICDASMESMVRRGGGFRGVETRQISESIVVAHLLLDCRDAMGANLVNTVAEAAAPRLAEISGGRVGLRILSNLCTHRVARCEATFTPRELDPDGDAVVDAIVEAYEFARLDPFRACTNNKGVMNAISAVALATGQDWRAVEAAAHAYCGLGPSYAPMAAWRKNDDGDLVGAIELPMAVGTVGGNVKLHPAARANLKILGVDSAADLAKVLVAAGLAQNLAALRALATDGIQKGHMRLHARSRQDIKV
ncbi:hypothetical protein CTAYLR_002547 [Chrysophaeum taylorii]|uniref:3-hydroxy-3-methylglutaryl coenzyme A reductase n=1 Tax=Chrysophaeum taylorii TaxID=2483200 RepID=A0AAD7XLE4_9STRA|nr:hypothetical protein CTAYLR_002547 [Chrysophaeum taylorii]